VKVSTEVGGYLDTTETSVLTPSVAGSLDFTDARVAVDAHYLLDIVSAASPDIVATASPRWEEVRHAGGVGVRYQGNQYGVSADASVSYTPDYLSIGGALTGRYETANKMATGWIGASYFRDVIGRTGTSFSDFSHAVDKLGVVIGYTPVLSESAFISFVGDAGLELGDPSKPYRYIPMFAADVAETVERGAGVTDVALLRSHVRPLEQLPTTRVRVALTTRLGVRWSRVTLRLDERLFADSWRLLASTTDLRLPWDVHDRVRIWPHLRLHAQTGVSFWERAYVAETVEDIPALRTGDRELGPLVNGGLGGGVRFALTSDASSTDVALQLSGLATVTSFLDALYIRERASGLLALGFEVGW
jgi:hypothetical protein